MERKLREALWDDERILWFGRPTQSTLLRSPDTLSQCMTWAITALLTLFAFFFFLPYALADGKEFIFILVILITMVFLPLTIAIRPYLDKLLLERETVYAITDRRIIAIVRNNVMTMPRTEHTRCAVDGRDGAGGNVYFDSAIGSPLEKSRANAVTGFKRSNNAIHGIIFFHVHEPDQVVQLLAAAS